MTLMADALDLVHRLPHTWRRVQTLEVPVWRARRVAQQTHTLSVKAAAHVDRALAPRLPTLGVTLLDRTIAQAIAKLHARGARHPRGTTPRQTWDVTLHHPNPTEYAGTSELHVRGDTMTLTHLYDRICATAAHLDLTATTTPSASASQGHRPSARGPAGRHPEGPSSTCTSTPTTSTRRHVAAGGPRSSDPPPSPSSRTGSATPGSPSNPSSTCDRTDPVDAHDPPAWMRELVILRDPRCVFPHCQRDARACDLDHIIPYDDTGPPGQTRPANLAPLCRRHHRAKTTGRWRYRRQPDGTYQWTGPHGTTLPRHALTFSPLRGLALRQAPQLAVGAAGWGCPPDSSDDQNLQAGTQRRLEKRRGRRVRLPSSTRSKSRAALSTRLGC